MHLGKNKINLFIISFLVLQDVGMLWIPDWKCPLNLKEVMILPSVQGNVISLLVTLKFNLVPLWINIYLYFVTN